MLEVGVFLLIADKMNELKLTYTDEMKKQDELWNTESEDVNVMEQLQRQVIDEAKEKGWKGAVVFWQGDGESIVDIADNQEEHEKGNEVESHGTCRSVIARIEADMRTKANNEDNTEKSIKSNRGVIKETNNRARRVRAWDKYYKWMDHDFFVSSDGEAYERPSNSGDTPHIEIEQTDDLVVMEFVGKDDFGNDIFEGDIVRWYSDFKGNKVKYAEVRYDEEAYGYFPMCKGEDLERLRVVGNIYENEELKRFM